MFLFRNRVANDDVPKSPGDNGVALEGDDVTVVQRLIDRLISEIKTKLNVKFYEIDMKLEQNLKTSRAS